MSTKAIIDVVSAAIVRACPDGKKRLFLGQRGPRSSYAYSWCTVGGKVEPGESPYEALHRELVEEVGLDPCALFYVTSVVYSFGGERTTASGEYELNCYLVDVNTERLTARPEHGIVGTGLFTAEEVFDLPLAAADAANRNALIALLRD